MKKVTTILFALLVGTCAVMAQTYDDYEDVIYLKDGSIIRGIIVEEVPNVSVKIKSGPNIFNYTFEQVEKFTKELIHQRSGARDFGFKPKGFVANYELGLTDIVNGSNVPMFSIILSHGYQVNPYFSVGIALGGEVSSKDIYNVPMYADFRIYPLKTRATPYFNLGLGYNLMVAQSSSYYSSSTSVQHGFMTAPATGVRIAINKKVAISVGVGYKYIGNPTKNSYYGSSGISVASFHCVTFRTGISF